MPLRIPNTHSPEEVRRAFSEMKKSSDVIDQGALGYVLIGQGVGTTPVWTTDLTYLTLLTVDNITVNGATITSDTGAISFIDEDLTTTGVVSAGQLTVDNITINGATITSDTGSISFGDDNLNTTGAITATTSAGVISGYSLVTTSGGLTSPSGNISIGDENFVLSGNIALISDANSIQFGIGQDAKIWYDGSDMYIDPQAVGSGDLHLNAGAFCIGRAGASATGQIDVSYTTSKTATSPIGVYSTVFYGSAGSGNMSNTVYGAYCNAQTTAAYDGDVTSLQGFRNVSIHKGSGTVANMYGGGFAIAGQAGAGVITNMRGLSIACTSVETTTNMYGIYIEDIDDAATLNYAIYTNNGTVYFKGNVGIGHVTPNQKLHVNGNIKVDDNDKIVCGTGNDALIYYDATDLIINPKFVGSGAVKVTGDQYFSGSGTGLPYAEIFCYEVGTTITISGTGVANKVQVTAFDTNGVSNQMTPDHTNDHITVDKAGTYLITASISMTSTGGTAYVMDFAVWKNNGATELTNMHAHRSLSGGGGDTGSMSLSGIATLSASDTLEMWCYNATNTNNIIIESATLSAVMIGG